MAASSSKKLIETYIDLLGLLECPVCYEYGTSPITICQQGHLICGPCGKNISNCPICKSKFSEIRARILDKICETVTYPCSKVGCGVMVSSKDVRTHEEQCACSEEPKLDKDTTLPHNILKHIEDNYASFFTGQQDPISELGLCLNCLNSLDISDETNASETGGLQSQNQMLVRTVNPQIPLKQIDKQIQCDLGCPNHQCTLQNCTSRDQYGIDTIDSETPFSHHPIFEFGNLYNIP